MKIDWTHVILKKENALLYCHAKATYLYMLIGLVQLFYITVLTTFNLETFIVFILTFLFGYSVIKTLKKSFEGSCFVTFESRFFTLAFIVCAIFTIFFSRLEYVTSTLYYGLSETRNNDQLGGGGAYTFLTVFFYPLAIASVFYNRKSKLYPFFFAVTIIVGSIDLLALGMRNTVFFVFLFRIIYGRRPVQRINKKDILFLLLIIVISLITFEFTTRVRSGYDGDIVDYWFEKSVYSQINDLSEVRYGIYDFANQYCYYLLPLFYMVSYISHSIVEFSYFLQNYDSWFVPKFVHIYDYYQLASFGDRSYSQIQIADGRIRTGVYQTLYTSLIVDFGIYIFPLFVIMFFYIYSKKLGSFGLLILPVAALSLIENYIYTGFTPIRAILLYIILKLFVKVKKYDKFSAE